MGHDFGLVGIEMEMDDRCGRVESGVGRWEGGVCLVLREADGSWIWERRVGDQALSMP